MSPTVLLGVVGGTRGVVFLFAFALVGGLSGVGIETGEFFEDSELEGVGDGLSGIGFLDGGGCGNNVVSGWRWSGFGHCIFDGLEVGFDDVHLLGVAEVGGRDDGFTGSAELVVLLGFGEVELEVCPRFLLLTLSVPETNIVGEDGDGGGDDVHTEVD